MVTNNTRRDLGVQRPRVVPRPQANRRIFYYDGAIIAIVIAMMAYCLAGSTSARTARASSHDRSAATRAVT